MSEFTQIGHTKKAHGTIGEIKVAIEEDFEDHFIDTDCVWLEIKGSKMPYFIEEIRGGGDLIVKFEGVDNRDQAIAIQSRSMFVKSEDLEEIATTPKTGLAYEHYEGFEIIDQNAGPIGFIKEVIDLPQQEMAVVEYEGRELLIPLHPQFITRIDDEKREVLMNLPEGLLEL